MSEDPRLSVLVTAYKRDVFLPDALDSLRRQTLSPDAFEVLVATDANPARLSRHVEGLNVKWLEPPTSVAGKDLASAIRTSRGGIIVLLDDDDVFQPEKLEAVDRAFRSDSELVYFHNNFAVIDEHGVVMESHPFRASDRRARLRIGFLRLSGSDPWATLRRYPPLSPDFNSSSIAVRHEVVEDKLEILERMPFAVDAFFFTAAALAGRAMALDPRILTLYRIHSMNYSGVATAADPLAGVRWFTLRALPGYEEVARMASESGNAAAARETDELVRVHRLYATLRNSDVTRRAVWRAWRHAREFRDTYVWETERYVQPAAMLYLAWPRLAQMVYAQWLARRARPPQGANHVQLN